MVLCGISTPFGVLFPCLGKVAHALLTRPPLKQLIASYSLSPLDLHVLGTPPAFVLSQDQTLSFNPLFPQSSFLNQVSLIRNYCHVCVVIVLYRFQGSYRSRKRLFSGSRNQLCQYTTFSPSRQVVLGRFLRFFAFFWDFRTISTFSRHHRSPFSEPSSLFPFCLFVCIIRRHLSACFHRGCRQGIHPRWTC